MTKRGMSLIWVTRFLPFNFFHTPEKLFFEPLGRVVCETLNPSVFKKKIPVLLTSRYAAYVASQVIQDRERPFFCVGKSSQAFLLQQGFSRVFCPTEEGAKHLLTEIKKQFKTPTSFYYLRGEEVHTDLAYALCAYGHTVHTYKVYKVNPTPKLSPSCVRYLKENAFSDVTFYSRKTVDFFLQHLKQEEISHVSFRALCKSHEIGEYLRSYLPIKYIVV